MSENSNIAWTDHTFNPWIGCTRVSPGCAHCYAETLMDHRYGRVKWGKGQERSRTSEANWKLPLKWNRYPIRSTGYEARRPRVFCASLADWLDAEVPIEWLADLLSLIYATPNLDWLLLTKRPENWSTRLYAALHVMAVSDARSMVLRWVADHRPPQNVWIGVTAEDQQRADERIPKLIEIPTKVRFLSCEPLLGAVEIEEYLEDMLDGGYVLGSAPIHWVITGCESHGKKAGRNAEHYAEHARSIIEQCRSAGVLTFNKQMPLGGNVSHDTDLWPSDLRARLTPSSQGAQ